MTTERKEAHRVQRSVSTNVFLKLLGLQDLRYEVRVCDDDSLRCQNTMTDRPGYVAQATVRSSQADIRNGFELLKFPAACCA